MLPAYDFDERPRAARHHLLPTVLHDRLDRLTLAHALHRVEPGGRSLERTLATIDFLATAGAEALVLHLPHAELRRAAEADLHTSLAWLSRQPIVPCPLT
jgi:hypothetical protein